MQIVDADEAGHLQLRKPEIREQLLRVFGKGIAAQDGEIDRKQLVALFNRGQLYLASGDKAKAKSDFQAVLEIAPGHKEAKAQLDAIAKAGG